MDFVITKGLGHFLKVQRVVYQGQQFGIDHSSDYTLKATVPLPLPLKENEWLAILGPAPGTSGTPRYSKVLQGTPTNYNLSPGYRTAVRSPVDL